MASKEVAMVRTAAMQYDRDKGMKVADIAKKYNVSTVTVSNTTYARKPMLDTKHIRLDVDFAERWDRARYIILLGLRSAWPDEWNEVRFRLLGRRVI